VVLTATYLAAVLPYSLLTRAWEPSDEAAHTRYIQDILVHHALPRISLANGAESHQPPLYYLLAAVWQKLLFIPAFTPTPVANPNAPAGSSSGRFFTFLHNYTPVQHQDAIYVHELRLLSVLFGLLTVLLSYGCACLFLKRPLAALSVGLLVALLPKQLVVDSAVTNDSLVIALSCLALFVFLLSEKARAQALESRRRWLMLALGVVLGLAAITKFNSLPLACLLIVLTALPALRERRLVLDSAYAVGGFFVISGWWFIRNEILYGQFSASRESLAYLKPWLPALIDPVPWTNTARFLHFVPYHLFRSVWYDGGWNQLQLPTWINFIVWALAVLSICAAISALVARRDVLLLKGTTPISIAGLVGSVLAGIVAVLLIAKSTTQAEGRIAFVGLAAFAILLVLGTDFFVEKTRFSPLLVFAWPAAMVGVNIYIYYEFLLPLRGL
jgi:4-amino-4-deoxy-L-arabinose transferase-like glycosyltransferase